MNEFIVWDEEHKEFLEDSIYVLNSKGKLTFMNKVIEDKKAFNYIGLKDINNNKIYADSSIFEFAHRYSKGGVVYDCVLRGLFIYDSDKLRYIIELLENDIYKVNYIEYDEDCGLFNIIDTIQQNKLGLIK